MGHRLGSSIRMQVFGESHGVGVGVVVEGIPPGMPIDTKAVQSALDKRRPGASKYVTKRNESDTFEIVSGVMDNVATGAPITLLIKNKDVDSSAYVKRGRIPRPGHADFPAMVRFGGHQDLRGSGMFSGRMTAAFVMAGALVMPILDRYNVKCASHIVQVGELKDHASYSIDEIASHVYANSIPCVDSVVATDMAKMIESSSANGDSIGAAICCRIEGMPVGVGEPMFDSIESVIAHAMFSIPAVKGIEFGKGFGLPVMKGSEANDEFYMDNGIVRTESNNSGGILGGLSNGMPIEFCIAFKPTPSISISQSTVDMDTSLDTSIIMKGRHDPCIGIRAVPVVTYMTIFCIADLLWRWNNGSTWNASK